MAPGCRRGVNGADRTSDEPRMGCVCRKHGLSNQTGGLEECSRRGTSLEHVVGHCTYLERLRAGERLCHEKQGREQCRTPLCHRGMLDQEEDQTVRPLLGLAIPRVMVVGLRMVLEEMMHPVGARHRQEGEECQHRTERAQTASPPAHLSPPWPATCPEGTHNGTGLMDPLPSRAPCSCCWWSILARCVLGSKRRVAPDRHGCVGGHPGTVSLCCNTLSPPREPLTSSGAPRALQPMQTPC